MPEATDDYPDMLAACRAEQPEAVKEALVGPLLAGLASHHAGCLPAWKALVEKCFQQGLLKVCKPSQAVRGHYKRHTLALDSNA